jgi:hypothetical protein
MRFYVPETAEDELALVSARVRQRRDGLPIVVALFSGAGLVGALFVLVASLYGRAAQLLLPLVVVLIVIPGAVLVIAGASSLMWRSRLRRLAQRKPHDRPRVRARHHRLLRGCGRVHPRLRPALRRAS